QVRHPRPGEGGVRRAARPVPRRERDAAPGVGGGEPPARRDRVPGDRSGRRTGRSVRRAVLIPLDGRRWRLREPVSSGGGATMATCTTNADGTRCWGRVLLVVAEAMLKARERGWDRTAEELAEMLADPE